MFLIWQAKHYSDKIILFYALVKYLKLRFEYRILKWTNLDGRWSQLSVGDRDSGSPGTCPADRDHCSDTGCRSRDCCKSCCCLGSPLLPLRTLNEALTIKVSELQITFHSWLRNKLQLRCLHDRGFPTFLKLGSGSVELGKLQKSSSFIQRPTYGKILGIFYFFSPNILVRSLRDLIYSMT